MKKYFIIAVLGIVSILGIPSHKAEAAAMDISLDSVTSITQNSARFTGTVHSTDTHIFGFLGSRREDAWPLRRAFILTGPGESLQSWTSSYLGANDWRFGTPTRGGGYGSRLPVADATSTGPFSLTVNHLTCGTDYDVDVTAGHDMYGGRPEDDREIYSATRSPSRIHFRTLPCPPPVLAVPSAATTSVSAVRVTGNIDLRDASSSSDFGFEYAPSSTFPSTGYTSRVNGAVGLSYCGWSTSGCTSMFPVPASISAWVVPRLGWTTAPASPYSQSSGQSTSPFMGGNFTADITSLTCGVTYHIRTWGTTIGGTAYSPDTTFSIPCTPPSVRTDPSPPISGVTASSVNLTGQVLSMGGAPTVDVGFVYGPTVAYGFTTPSTIVSSMSWPSPLFTHNISGLVCGQTYQYSAYVRNGSATVYGANKTFSTLACGSPAVETSLPTIGSGPTPGASWFYATFHGTLTYLGGFPSATVSFRYGPTTAYGTTVPATGTGVMSALGVFSSYRIGLPCGTYHWQAVATGPGGVAYGVDRTFNGCAEVRPGDDVRGDDTPRPGTGSSGGGVLILPGSTSIDLESAIGGEIAAYFAEIFAPEPEIPEAVPELLGRASLLFLVNGGASASALPGSPVTLTWQVANIAPNSCVGTSTDSSSTLWRDTAKAPLRDISPDTLETYSEVLIASEMPTVSYTMQECKGFDGSTVPPQTVTVNSTSVVETPIPAVSAPEPLVPVATPTEPTMRWFER